LKFEDGTEWLQNAANTTRVHNDASAL